MNAQQDDMGSALPAASGMGHPVACLIMAKQAGRKHWYKYYKMEVAEVFSRQRL